MADHNLHDWFSHRNGAGGGWVDCKASRKGHLVPCGRAKAGKGTARPYPACRRTLAHCNRSKTKKKGAARISWTVPKKP